MTYFVKPALRGSRKLLLVRHPRAKRGNCRPGSERAYDTSDATAEVVRRQLGYDLGAVTWHRIEASGAPSKVATAAERILAG